MSENTITRCKTKRELVLVIQKILERDNLLDFYRKGLTDIKCELSLDIAWNVRTLTLDMAKKRVIANMEMINNED